MDIVEKCPLPELAEALKPYIKPREEVTKIRADIDALLAEHVREDDTPLSRVTLHSSNLSVHSGLDSPFTGVRKAFIRALIARQKAQAQYDSLKAELGSMRYGNDQQDENNGKDEEENPVAETVSLIRQRQRQKKLLIIGRTLDNLEKARQNSRHVNVTELLNGGMQSQPPPPLVQQGQDEHMIEAQSHVFELQKAVLRAQARLQTKDHLQTPQETTSGDQIPSENGKRAFALRQARDDLISWIEGELAKLSDDSIQDSDPRGDEFAEHETQSLEEVQSTLRELYDTYIVSRETLVGVLNTKSRAESSVTTATPETALSKDSDMISGAGLASTILPFVESLRSTSQDETALMQHTSYIRRQLTAVSSDTDQLITHLSEESHLVRPGTSHATSWTGAAREARMEDLKAIRSNLALGEDSVGGARIVLASAHMDD